MTDLTPRPVPLEQTRQRIVDQLCDQYAAENLTDEMLEERLGKAFAATTVPALQALVADLPVAGPASSTAVAVARAGAAAEREVVLAVMGGAERKGMWTPPHRLNVVAVMGGVELDFRQAIFPAGVTEVNIFVMMGGVEIVAPSGVRVEMNGMALMGGFGHRAFGQPPPDPDAPVLRIGGVAIMGGVDLKVLQPNETERDARARERLARREARRLGRGE